MVGNVFLFPIFPPLGECGNGECTNLVGYAVGAALAAYTCAAAGFMWREAAKRWGGDGPPVEGGWQNFRVWVVQGWFVCDELCV